MILGDLLHSHVVTHDGVALGRVVDVRLAVEVVEPHPEPGGADEREHAGEDAPLVEQTHTAAAVGRADVVGLLVSPHTGGSFLGYERREVRSPWVVAALIRWRHRGTFLVAWDEVERIAPGLVHLADGFRRLDPMLP